MVKTVKVGVLGLGRHGTNHVLCYDKLPQAELVAVCDANASRAEEIAREFGVRAYTSADDLFADRDVEAVSIVSPEPLHAEHVIAAAGQGKHVMVEKPMATTVEDGEKMIEACDKAGVQLFVGHSFRFAAPFAVARSAVDQGEIGRIAYIRIQKNSARPVAAYYKGRDTGVILGEAVHPIDSICWFARGKIKSVFARIPSNILSDKGWEDGVISILEFDNNVTARLEVLWCLPEGDPGISDMQMLLIGTDGSLHVDAHHRNVYLSRRGASEGHPRTHEFLNTMYCNPAPWGKYYGYVPDELEAFVKGVADGTPPLVDGKAGLEAVRIGLAMQESAEKGCVVNL